MTRFNGAMYFMKMKTTLVSLFLSFSFLCVSSVVAEEDFSAILKRTQELKDKGLYAQAITELGWATKQLEKLHGKKLEEFFPTTVGSFTKNQVKSENALGFSRVEGSYKGANNTQVKISLLGSAASEGGAARGLGALAGFAQMAATMKQGDGENDVVRVKGQRATVENSGGSRSLTLPMQSGMIFKVESRSKAVTQEDLVALAEGFDLQAIENYLRAQ